MYTAGESIGRHGYSCCLYGCSDCHTDEYANADEHAESDANEYSHPDEHPNPDAESDAYTEGGNTVDGRGCTVS